MNCDGCAPGTSAPAGSAACDECGVGTYSTDGLACISCANGTYAATSGSVSCAAFVAGTVSNAGAAACSECPSGKSSEAGAARCTFCEEGKYARETGSAVCQRCETTVGKAYTSTEGSASCDLCRSDSYMDRHGNCSSCPTGATCELEGTTLRTLEIEPGHYRLDAISARVYECTKAKDDACVGGNGTGSQLCANGYTAPLCSRCDATYYRDMVDGTCKSCYDDQRFITPANLILVLILMAAVAAGVAFYGPLNGWYDRHKDWITQVRDQGTVVFIAGQIIVNLQDAHRFSGGGGFPKPYDSAVSAVEMIELDAPAATGKDAAKAGAPARARSQGPASSRAASAPMSHGLFDIDLDEGREPESKPKPKPKPNSKRETKPGTEPQVQTRWAGARARAIRQHTSASVSWALHERTGAYTVARGCAISHPFGACASRTIRPRTGREARTPRRARLHW